MYKFSKRSKDRLRTCHPLLEQLCNDALATQEMDITVLCGYRNEDEQNKLYEQGISPLKGGESKHNEYLSRAVDIAPYPIDWNDTARFDKLAELMKRLAQEKAIKIKWGGDFSYYDGVHFELED